MKSTENSDWQIVNIQKMLATGGGGYANSSCCYHYSYFIL